MYICAYSYVHKQQKLKQCEAIALMVHGSWGSSNSSIGHCCRKNEHFPRNVKAPLVHNETNADVVAPRKLSVEAVAVVPTELWHLSGSASMR